MAKEMNCRRKDATYVSFARRRRTKLPGDRTRRSWGQLLKRGIRVTSTAAGSLSRERPQVAVSGVRDRSGQWQGVADDTVQRELRQDSVHAGIPEAVTPADPGPQENLAVLGKQVERQQIREAPEHHAFEHDGCR